MEKADNLRFDGDLQPLNKISDRMGGPVTIAVVMAGLLVWLWPIGLGGEMPVGGDVTQFFLGLFGVLSRSLKEGRLPVWNGLWGYGFPGIGESQMGVYYPCHLVLYGGLRVEWAYLASLLLHTLWGGLGAWWAARQFGVSHVGSALTALAFSASGFFVIHMPHPWGYTTGSWMPWAWGLSWSILTGSWPASIGRLSLLSLVLVLQVLPGHFQIAFQTQLAIVLLVIWYVIDPAAGAIQEAGAGASPSRASGARRVLSLVGSLAMVFPLSALQLWPTARLARLAADQRDFEYLSLCAATPLHLVNLVAPGLFHRSALWRPLVWTPFHTSPEELLFYVGLAPLFLAVLEVRYRFRRDPAVRAMVMLAAVSLFLSLGPFVPGFRLLIAAPGFSFFRAPARWTLVTSLALAILAGRGFDRCREHPDLGRSLSWLAGLAAAWIALVLVLIELAVLSGSQNGHPWLADLFQATIRTLPWTPELPMEARRFIETRFSIYAGELATSAGLLAAIAALGWLATRRRTRGLARFLPGSLLALTALDLMLLGQHRLVSTAPLRPLAELSPVLARLAEEPRGTRVVDNVHNLSMLIGLAPISAYRTLDLPALEPLTRLAQARRTSPGVDSAIRKALRICGVGLRVVDPVTGAAERSGKQVNGKLNPGETLDDPALASWLYGPEWNAERGGWATRFRIVREEGEPSRAWFLPLTGLSDPAMLDSWSGDLEALLRLFDGARPLSTVSRSPERLDVSLNADGPGWVIVTQLADPQWEARWTGDSGLESTTAEILPTFRRKPSEGGWQRIRVPGPGRWSLRLEYQARDVHTGLVISGVSWLAWGAVLGLARWRRGKRSET